MRRCAPSAISTTWSSREICPKKSMARGIAPFPTPQYPPMLGHDTYLSGDGMISAFKFENGHIDSKMKYIMTDCLKPDRKGAPRTLSVSTAILYRRSEREGRQPLREQHDSDFPRGKPARH